MPVGDVILISVKYPSITSIPTNDNFLLIKNFFITEHISFSLDERVVFTADPPA